MSLDIWNTTDCLPFDFRQTYMTLKQVLEIPRDKFLPSKPLKMCNDTRIILDDLDIYIQRIVEVLCKGLMVQKIFPECFENLPDYKTLDDALLGFRKICDERMSKKFRELVDEFILDKQSIIGSSVLPSSPDIDMTGKDVFNNILEALECVLNYCRIFRRVIIRWDDIKFALPSNEDEMMEMIEMEKLIEAYRSKLNELS